MTPVTPADPVVPADAPAALRLPIVEITKKQAVTKP